ncbi:zinc and cadmium transporter [Saccharomonospora amisosensis]|uniref:Zinc and cadmium transporter n=1 Tax=Saccharomonospora amisosensis TaxID=1128677 RepID=A0A7X5UU34_9PSEU|nr:ZIP family metal transporter [Saccharomonospora amisosensis]NIJ14269.1 zinc and cadmium transporter [Saccharomonospora amisosensis]
MSTLAWIIVSGLLMSAIALTGSLTLLLPPKTFNRLVLPLVALAAGSLLGGALFHMLRESVAALGNELTVYGWLALGIVTFFVLEQYLHWHHCHRPVSEHGHVGYLILLADGLHNLIGGLAVGSAFILDIELGIVTWLVAAAHEVPQELGDFGILVHSGWSKRQALSYNGLSALTFLVGGVIAYGLAGSIDVSFLVPFAAGNFIYIAAADLLPRVTVQESPVEKVSHTVSFFAGLGLLYLIALVAT